MKIYFIVVAQKEEEDLRRWKEANRATAVHLNPEKLGNQHLNHLYSHSHLKYNALFVQPYALFPPMCVH